MEINSQTLWRTVDADELLDAVYELYYSAHWTTEDLDDDRAGELWEAVRDAAGFDAGE